MMNFKAIEAMIRIQYCVPEETDINVEYKLDFDDTGYFKISWREYSIRYNVELKLDLGLPIAVFKE